MGDGFKKKKKHFLHLESAKLLRLETKVTSSQSDHIEANFKRAQKG